MKHIKTSLLYIFSAIIPILLLLTTTVLVGYSQQPGAASVKKGAAAFETMMASLLLDDGKLSYTMQMQFKKDSKDVQSKEEVPVRYYGKGNNLYRKVGNVETIHNAQYVLDIYHDEKEIIVRKKSPQHIQGKETKHRFFDTALLAKEFDSCYTITQPNQQQALHFRYKPGSTYKEYIVHYNTALKLIEGISLIYHPIEEHGITYNAISEGKLILDKQHNMPETAFNELAYISELAPNATGIGSCKDYNVKIFFLKENQKN